MWKHALEQYDRYATYDFSRQQYKFSRKNTSMEDLDACLERLFCFDGIMALDEDEPLIPVLAKPKKQKKRTSQRNERVNDSEFADLMAEDFQFAGPVVGPLSKDAFVSAISSVDIKTGFPDFNPEFYGFRVDPFEGNRVWYTARGRGTRRTCVRCRV